MFNIFVGVDASQLLPYPMTKTIPTNFFPTGFAMSIQRQVDLRFDKTRRGALEIWSHPFLKNNRL